MESTESVKLQSFDILLTLVAIDSNEEHTIRAPALKHLKRNIGLFEFPFTKAITKIVLTLAT